MKKIDAWLDIQRYVDESLRHSFERPQEEVEIMARVRKKRPRAKFSRLIKTVL